MLLCSVCSVWARMSTPPGTAGTNPSLPSSSRPPTTVGPAGTSTSSSSESRPLTTTTDTTITAGAGVPPGTASLPGTAGTSNSSGSTRVPSRGKPGGYRVLDDGRVLNYNVRYYRDGSVYEGEFLGSKRHGTGTLVEKGVGKYEGDFVDNLFHGSGVYTWLPPVLSDIEKAAKKVVISEKRYEGEWVNGKKEGFGHFKMEDGSEYHGNFKRDKYHGSGKLTTKEGDSYEGEWIYGKLDGEGKISFANGDEYTGELLDGCFDGEGHYIYSTKDVVGGVRAFYRGEYFKGHRHGRGTRVFANGSKYDGKFCLGDMDGHGIMAYANGNQYIGEWKHGLAQGQGVLILKHGDRYEGQFFRGMMYGKGRYMYEDGGSYDGEYLATKGGYEHGVRFPDPNGKRCGQGRRMWVSGSVYKGMWADDKMDGPGVLTKGMGGSYDGQWRGNQRQGTGKEAWGNRMGTKYVCPLGHAHPGKGFCTYEGGYVNGVMEGKGRLACMDGRSYEGEWCKGKRQGRGTQVFIPHEERGDSQRQYIGGVGGMYRPMKYEGEWVEGQRTGKGFIEYANGLRVYGQFKAGRLLGVCTTVYPGPPASDESKRKKRLGVYEKGCRVMWITPVFTDEEGSIDDPNKPPPPPKKPVVVVEDTIEE